MTDTDTTTTTENAQPADHDREPRDITTYLYWGLLVVLGLFALIAGFQFYSSGQQVIRIWVSREYEPLFQAAFNLAVLLVAGLGISWVVARLNE